MTGHLDDAIVHLADAVRALDRAAMSLDFAGRPRAREVVKNNADGVTLVLGVLCEIRGNQPRVINRDTSTEGTS